MLFYVFHAVFALIALWLVVAGAMSFRTGRITLYVGNKPFGFEGGKAIAAGIFSAIVGMVFLGYAIWAFYGHYTATNAG